VGASVGTALLVAACSAGAPVGEPGTGASDNRYAQVNLAASGADYHARFTDATLVNAWGIAIRPKGAGGHFWVGAGGTSFEYVGDVTKSADPALRPLHQDGLRAVSVPGADSDVSDASIGKTTGVIFNPAPLTSDKFVVTGQPVTVGGVEQKLTGSARFIFATDSGKISGWTEQGAGGQVVRADGPAKEMFDGSEQGMAFFGLALTPDGNSLLAADFGKDPQIRQFDKNWKPVAAQGFVNPFATGEVIDAAHGKKVKPGDPSPFNITTVGNRVFVAYAVTKPAHDGAPGFDVAEEDSLDKDQEAAAQDKPAKGKLAEFDATGKLVRVFADGDRLNAPWGVAVAPAGFGPLSGKVLVGNFGGAGRILAYDDKTGEFADFLRGADGKPIAIEGLWGLLFGNGESLGDSDALYFTAGPGEEKHGLFGALRHTR
jgi:uncharacterized protein (TIGR03118 family)